MKKQFKLAVERNIEFSILKRKITIQNYFENEKKNCWEEDLYKSKKQIREIAKFLPSAPGLLVITKKSDEILQVIFSNENIRERFLQLKSKDEFEKLIVMMRSKSLRTIKISYAREIRA